MKKNNWKKYLLPYFLPLLFWQCQKDDLVVAFRMEYPNLTFDIPAGLNTLDSHFFILRSIPTNKNFFFGNNDEASIVEITPSFARIVGLQSNLADYGFINEIVVRICQDNEVNQTNVVEKCRREIFFREGIPLNVGNRVDLLPNSNNLKAELTEETFTVVLVLRRLRDFSPINIPSRLEMQFQAKR